MKKRAYAKINLALNVVGKKDNMHLLDMIMVEVNLFDEIELTLIPESKIKIEGMDFVDVEKNLMYKAVKKFEEYTKINVGGVLIKINKKIPHEAGMGGGSSDAVCVIKILNEQFKAGLSCEDIAKIGISLGSDCPFFAYGGICRVEGVGEKVKKLSDKIISDITIVKPKFGLSTKMIFEECDKSEFVVKKELINEIENSVKGGAVPYRLAFNDLEYVCTKCSEIGLYIESLKEYYEYVFMTGSGSAIICANKKNNKNIDQIKKIISDVEIFII